MAYSTFPSQIDTFVSFSDIGYNDIPKVTRLQTLRLKQNLTLEEQQELQQLNAELRNKIPSAEDWNKFCECLVSMEVFIRDNIVGFIDTMKESVTLTVNNGIKAINTTKDTAIATLNKKEQDLVIHIDSVDATSLRNDLGIMANSVITGRSLIDKTNTLNTQVTSAVQTATDAKNRADSAFQLGNENKELFVATLVAKGQVASITDSWTVLQQKFRDIPMPVGTANASDVLSGKTFTNSQGTYTGTIPVRATGDFIARGLYKSGNILKLNIPESAYYSNATNVTYTDNNWIESNIKSGISVFGKTGTFTNDANATSDKILNGYSGYVAGQKVNGTVPIMGSSTNANSYRAVANGNLYVGIPNGAYMTNTPVANSPEIVINDGNILPQNIKEDVTVLGVKGTLRESCRPILTGDTSLFSATTLSSLSIKRYSKNIIQGTHWKNNFTHLFNVNYSGTMINEWNRGMFQQNDPNSEYNGIVMIPVYSSNIISFYNTSGTLLKNIQVWFDEGN